MNFFIAFCLLVCAVLAFPCDPEFLIECLNTRRLVAFRNHLQACQSSEPSMLYSVINLALHRELVEEVIECARKVPNILLRPLMKFTADSKIFSESVRFVSTDMKSAVTFKPEHLKLISNPWERRYFITLRRPKLAASHNKLV